MRRRLDLVSKWRLSERASQARVPLPEIHTHRSDSQKTAAERRHPGEPLVGVRVEDDKKTEEEDQPNHEANEDPHSESGVSGRQMGDRGERDSQQKEEPKMEQRIFRDGLRNDPVNGRYRIAGDKDLAEHVGRIERLPPTDVDRGIPGGDDQSAE